MFGRWRFAAGRFAEPGAGSRTRGRRGVGGSGFPAGWSPMIDGDDEKKRRERRELEELREVEALIAAGML